MAEVNEVVDYVESTENEIITDSKERFVIKVDDLKQSMGPWYSVFAVIILPFLLYMICMAFVKWIILCNYADDLHRNLLKNTCVLL